MNARTVVLGLFMSALSACGGGGGSEDGGAQSAAASTGPAGLYHGMTSTGRQVAGVVLENGEFWLLYTRAGSSTLIAGAEQGHYSASNGNFTTSDLKDFNLEGRGISNGSANGTYVAKNRIAGTVTFPSSTVTFSATYDTAYDAPPNQGAVAGTFTGVAAVVGGSETATVTISSSGALSGVGQSGCRFTGTATAHAGTVYTVSVTFAGGVCANGTSTVNGVAYFDPATNRVYAAALNSGRTNGFIFAGGK
jgi:hypothetical protein